MNRTEKQLLGTAVETMICDDASAAPQLASSVAQDGISKILRNCNYHVLAVLQEAADGEV